MAFVAAQAYDVFMGRWSSPLGEATLGRLDLRPGMRALDVGCGPGALTRLLVDRLGADAVVAVDPSAPFVQAARERLPGVDVRRGTAERLPLEDDAVDLAVAQLVVHFMSDPGAGLAEMGRVTRPGGLVAASVWDYGGSRAPLSPFWQAVGEIDPLADQESSLAGTSQGALLALGRCAGLADLREDLVSVTRRFARFDDWWEPFTLGVGPAGDYLAAVSTNRAIRVREHCLARLGGGPFTVTASAWLMTGSPG